MPNSQQPATPALCSPYSILDFWFSARVRPLWFRSTPEFDAEVRQRFVDTWQAARVNALKDWEDSASGALTLVIVLDQLPLNMYRGRPEAFATEAAARDVARRAIARGFDGALDNSRRVFLYLPFMHSEDSADQDYSVRLFAQPGMEDTLKWAQHHRDIVQRFGRFPHRNALLGRASSAAEIAYLESEAAYHG
jgi:uncharacterized protein (DUF924 family)